MPGNDPYLGREQTKAKHFILKTYLQALAFKVLNFSDVAYVDGFSGPWQARTEDFADTSFMIALSVLKDAQREYARRGKQRKIRCFFCEHDPDTYRKLKDAVAPYHKPDEYFEVQTYGGDFTDAVPDISAFTRNSFALIFIDPTGWTGYGFERIKPLLTPRLTEVIINYMHDFINRGVCISDAATVASFDPILGGPEWNDRLDPELVKLDRGMAAERLFRETLKRTGKFSFVVSTKIYRPTIDRPQFFLTYATKDKAGLETFRETEYRALKQQAADRFTAKEREREQISGAADMFAGMDAAIQSARIDDFVAVERASAADFILRVLSDGPRAFVDVWTAVLEQFVLRVTNVKRICADLARSGEIENTWGGGNRKPQDTTLIQLTMPHADPR